MTEREFLMIKNKLSELLDDVAESMKRHAEKLYETEKSLKEAERQISIISNRMGGWDLDRILSCIDACSDITTEALKEGVVEAGIEELKTYVEDGGYLYHNEVIVLKEDL
ncbi:MAG: hypothetical protein JXK93_10140 [Sphaerochaetaceae bacterium]|nr:hypothetical protein [Sphaerochaetaceae bacterium]